MSYIQGVSKNSFLLAILNIAHFVLIANSRRETGFAFRSPVVIFQVTSKIKCAR